MFKYGGTYITTAASRKLVESAFIVRIFLRGFVMEERVREETESLETATASVELFLLLRLLAMKNSYCATFVFFPVLLIRIKVLWAYDAVLFGI
jgi:hypothetical protein